MEKETTNDWKDRLVKEQAKLKERLIKLIEFISSDKFFKLSENYKTVLQNQKVAMEMYLQSLNFRLYEDLDDNTKQIPNFGALSLIAGMFSSPWNRESQTLPDFPIKKDIENKFKTTGVDKTPKVE